MNLFDDYCNLCEPFPLSAHIQSALFEKYSTSINFYHSQHIDPLLNDSLKPAWMKKLIQDKDSFYARLLRHHLNCPLEWLKVGHLSMAHREKWFLISTLKGFWKGFWHHGLICLLMTKIFRGMLVTAFFCNGLITCKGRPLMPPTLYNPLDGNQLQIGNLWNVAEKRWLKADEINVSLGGRSISLLVMLKATLRTWIKKLKKTTPLDFVEWV